MRSPVRLLIAAMLVTAVAVAGLVLLGPASDDPKAEPPTQFRTTPLEGFETVTLTVPRAGFCDDVDPRQVEAALGGAPNDASEYVNGDDVTLADGLDDVAHEFGCTWTGPDGTQARAWVFAPPVDADRAERLVRDAGKVRGCEASPTPPYGAPSVGLTCSGGGETRTSFRGLFGDAWLTCELTSTDAAVDPVELRERTGAWCVGVALGASAA